MKATGAEIFAFYSSKWPDTVYMDFGDGLDIDDNAGNCVLELDRKYDLSDFAVLMPQGWGTETERVDFFGGKLDFSRDGYVTFEKAFRIWKANTQGRTYAITVPKDDIAKFEEYAARQGWSIK